MMVHSYEEDGDKEAMADGMAEREVIAIYEPTEDAG